MEDVIDTFEQGAPEPVNLKRSARIFKISRGLFILSITTLYVIEPLLLEHYKELDWLAGAFVALPILTILVLAPIGLLNSWKSYKKSEGLAITRLVYLIGNLSFCGLLVLFMSILIQDIALLF